MELNPNILALLNGFGGGQRVGSGGQPMLPQFSGGQGLNPTLLALMTAAGLMPQHQDTQGRTMLPNQSQSKFPGLDAYRGLQQGQGSSLLTPQTQPGPTMLPNGFSNRPQTSLLPNPAFAKGPRPPLKGKPPMTY